MTVAEFILVVQRRLKDAAGIQWTDSFTLDAVNAAFSALCNTLPQAHVVHRDLTLVEGTEQVIDSDLHRIVHIPHNKCPITGDAKRSIVKSDLSVMDKVSPQWRQDSSRGYIVHYMLNSLDESKFYVWPAATAGQVLRGVFTKTPSVLNTYGGPGVVGESIANGGATAPVEPVDPGPLGFGATSNGIDYVLPAPYKTNATTAFRHFVAVGSAELIEEINGSPASSVLIPLDSVVELTFGEHNPGWGGPSGVSIDSTLHLDDSSGGNNIYDLYESDGTTPILSDDSRVVEGQRLRIIRTGSFAWKTDSDQTFSYDGVTQEQVDAYATAKAVYDVQTLGKIFLGTRMPFDRAHFLPLQEFALYYGLIRDDTNTSNDARAKQHWQNCFQLLNKQENAEVLVKSAEVESE